MATPSDKPRDFNLSGLTGISDRTLETHFGLYEGYINETKSKLLAWTRALILSAAVASCTGGAPIPPTYTQEELKAECDRHRGWWRPDDLRGGYCDLRGL